MKALVLGGTRFVGLRLVRYLASQGHDITILNRGRAQAQLPPGIKRLYADRRDPAAVRMALSGQEFDAVFDITAYEVGNLEPVVELLTGRVAHYVFQSTVGVYARSVFLPILEDFPRIAGTTSGKGLAAYEVNKVQCEDYLLGKYQESKFPVTILRCPTIYGPENWMYEREFSFFVRLLQGRRIIIPGNGSTILHMAHVDDVARAHLSVIGNEATLGEAFNIASADAVTIDGYIDIIAAIIGIKDVSKIYLDFPVMKGLARSAFPFPWDSNLFYGIGKAKERFGFSPRYGMKEGLKHTFEWWEKNLGIAKTRFEPGRLGLDVDLAYEDKVIKQYG